MAKKITVPPARYKRVARDLSVYKPSLRPLIKKRVLTPADKAKITRTEDQVHKLTRGSQRLLPLSDKQIRQLKDKKFVIPGLNAVVDRNLGDKSRAEVKGGRLFIRENGRVLRVVSADATDPDKFAQQASDLFKGKRGRQQVWVRFKNGRSNAAFNDEAALLQFIAFIYEKYEPDWAAEGHDIDEFIDGFEIYEKPPGLIKRALRRGGKPVKPSKKPRRKPSKKPKRKTPSRKPTKTRGKKPSRVIQRLIKKRFKPTKPVKKRSTIKRAKSPPRKRATKRVAKRGTTKKNRRNRLRN